jgi:hypothetical protein
MSTSAIHSKGKRGKYHAYYEYRITQSNSDCSSNELIDSGSDECYSRKGWFNGYLVTNPEYNRWLITNSWPHHDCTGGGYRANTMGPRSSSPCVIRPTYSWYGTFDGDDCNGHESDPRCANNSIFEFESAYSSTTALAMPEYWDGKWRIPWNIVPDKGLFGH